MVLFLKQYRYADMAELADAPDLGSGVYDVQVQVLLSAVRNGRRLVNRAFSAVILILRYLIDTIYHINYQAVQLLRFVWKGTDESIYQG